MYTGDSIRHIHKSVKRIDSNLIRLENMIPGLEKKNMIKEIYNEICKVKEEFGEISKGL